MCELLLIAVEFTRTYPVRQWVDATALSTCVFEFTSEHRGAGFARVLSKGKEGRRRARRYGAAAAAADVLLSVVCAAGIRRTTPTLQYENKCLALIGATTAHHADARHL